MRIQTVITKLSAYYQTSDIDPQTTRDQVLYGNVDQQCTGIVTCMWASQAVIQKAQGIGANLIICHEALFWNHGDHTDWLAEQSQFQSKKQLLDQTQMVVWRDHDHLHAGVPQTDGKYADGIFSALAQRLGWSDYAVGDTARMREFKLPKTTVGAILKLLETRLDLSGARVSGNLDQPVEHVVIPSHIFGDARQEILQADDIDLFLPMEIVEYSLAEYVADAASVGHRPALIACGHFALEAPGMAAIGTYLPTALGEALPCQYIASEPIYWFHQV